MNTVLATTVEIDTFLWVAGTLLAIIGFLIVMVGHFFYNKLKEVADDSHELGKKLDTQMVALTSKVEAERLERNTKIDEYAKATFIEINKTKEKCSDLSETVAGIGAVYATRNELNQLQATVTHLNTRPPRS